MMRDALDTYENNMFKDLDPEKDPFNEKQEPIELGQAFYVLEGLCLMMDNPRNVPIVSMLTNEIVGEVHINAVPCDENGNEEFEEEDLTDDPMDMLNKELHFKIKIDKITNLPEDFCRDIFCEYKFFLDETKYTTSVCKGSNQNPVLNYEHIHHVDCVTKFLIDYLNDTKLAVKIYGNKEMKMKKPQGIDNQQAMPRSNNSSANRRSSQMRFDSTNTSTMSSNSSLRVQKGVANPLGGR
jgi:hypothetical protein